MEAFESFVALAPETKGLVVSEALKFDIARQTTSGQQTHGYEVDLVGARHDLLVLASVKSYCGSRGVHADEVAGTFARASNNRRYSLLNQPEIRDRALEMAAEVRLQARPGRASALRREARRQTRDSRCPRARVVRQAAGRARQHQSRRRRRCRRPRARGRHPQAVPDNAALVALKVLDAAGALRPRDDDLRA